MSRFRLGSIVAVAAGILITTGGCGDSPSAAAVADEALLVKLPAAAGASLSGTEATGSVTAVIGPMGGTISLPEGHRLTFPAGALSAPTAITMSPDPNFVGVRLEPHGLQFPATAAPVLTLNAWGSTAGFASFSVVYVDPAGAILEVLPTRTVAGSQLRTELRHFSGYIGAGHRQ